MRQASIPTHVDVCSRHNSDSRTGRHGNNRRREHIEAERTQDGIGRHQEREGRQQEREGRQQEREGRQQEREDRQQEREDRQQEREDRQQEREDGQQKETEDGNTTPGEMGNIQRIHYRNSTDNEHRDLRQRQSGSCTSEEWKTEPDITKAVDIYRHQLLKAAESEEDLTIKLNMGHSPEDRERAILQFYKAPNINWARNLTVVLQGDAALGDGVKRFFFSQTISKLQFGFELNIEGPGKTLFFLGEEDHQVPSTSKILLDSGLYVVAGRMIGHSILHGGPGLSSLSPSVFSSLIGQDEEHVCLQDCPDMDLREIIQELDGDDDLSQSQTSKMNDLCLSWDLPFVNTENRRWLAEKVLVHAVLGRRREQLRQLRRGLKDSGLMPLLKERPDALNIIFPQASKIFVTPEMILDRIVWPSDSDTESDDGLDISTKCSVTAYLREYIESGTSDELLELLKFWVGWAVLPQHLYVKVKKVSMPTAVTCFETLKIPGHYLSYREFKMDLAAAVSTTDSGFGLV
ncbi:uncharacterized protein LOC125795235 isoform X1 [Astyanax mexicanus]|uniref:uncharacterized protein LOC125795235 isoform X1 n=1 Tax=Astyanax mexicanus TaxID=7994 RepID=UPI0020CAA5A0|nr:uncharacterized protein LOC125795235 isoform X1 [Astyanax mexicanus]